ATSGRVSALKQARREGMQDLALSANDVLSGKAAYALICGDSAEVLAALPDACVDMVMTSPPYWAVREYEGDSTLGNEATPEEYVENLVGILSHLERVLKPTG